MVLQSSSLDSRQERGVQFGKARSEAHEARKDLHNIEYLNLIEKETEGQRGDVKIKVNVRDHNGT